MPAQLAAGAVIDMMWMHDTRAPSFADKGWLLPMDDLLEAYPPPDWPDKFYKSQVESFRWNGKQYGIPYDIAPGGFYVNLDLLEEAGVDVPTEEWTMDDLLEAALKLSKDTDGDGEIDQWGVNISTGSGAFYWIVKNFGGDFWDETITESRFNMPETIAAFQYAADLIWKHKVMPSATMLQGIGLEGGTAFASGLIAMHWSLNDEAFALAEVVGDKFKWTTAPSPRGPAGRFQFVGGSAFSIPATSSQPNLAYELASWTLTNPANLKISGAMGSQFTGHVDYYEYGLPQPETGLDVEAFKHAMYDLGKRDGIHPVYHPKYLEWEPSVYNAVFDTLWIGEELDAAVACQQAHDLTNELLKS
jgi:multiple sugar transport system substrate-binding protein